MENTIEQRNEVFLAERSQRFFAFFIDAIFSFGVNFIIPLFLSFFSIMSPNVLSIISLLIVIIIQGNFLIKDGQTIGKRLISIRIIDSNTLEIPSIKNIFIIRYLLVWQVPNLLSIFFINANNFELSSSNPSFTTSESIISFIALMVLVQTLLIFKSDRRCGHDILSGTVVEKIEPNKLDPRIFRP
tara:strand:+ start:24055 stop:24612 length:558 start_codon:yes stop_codon:yes gene_type:complete